MSCGKGDHHHHSGNCVCDVVRAIADAQNEVVENCCDVSCENSIESLLDPSAANNLNTVPFILYGKKLKPFKGFGVDFQTPMNFNEQVFQCIESFIFRVKTVDDDCCAVLELLTFEETNGNGNGDAEPMEFDDPCEQINNENLADLTATGICLTVDLTCFCAITCLPAVSLS
ncbi:CotY/CotZ family spore coat protein [Calidifontibacillus oryziterrae]|uniref:CotY/CotZ family spore coat protein n=1 Tax=Calidifontibacillus oryziterrae TaxID=1191699 RepID=UPI0003056171|nr:CotY/CotZ family spore coat protein [Calidifontibacillus oryziterrae]